MPPGNISVLATEATRTAVNSEVFRGRIKEETGWVVRMLEKEEEGRVGGMGVVASFGGDTQGGLVMDLGGGSTQITWVTAGENGEVQTSPQGSFSFPYGAAALKARIEGGDTGLKDEMARNFQQAYQELEVPASLHHGRGLDLYLCGGGFRGWGYLLMERASVNPYPIPIINGFRVRKEVFHDTQSVLETVSDSSSTDDKVFGVSKRRASQVPAVAFLVSVLVDALPDIQNIQFCQGGVREGFLYDQLPPQVRAEDPLIAATKPFAPQSADAIRDLLSAALPSSSQALPPSFSHRLLSAAANLLYTHSPVPKETRSAAALHSTTSGILASANSLTHANRALLALILCERWDAKLAPTDQSLYNRLRQCVSAAEAWWCQYLGRVGALIGDVYPAGVISSVHPRIGISTTKEGQQAPLLLIIHRNPRRTQDIGGLEEHAGQIEKSGKKKNWLEGYGMKITVLIHHSVDL